MNEIKMTKEAFESRVEKAVQDIISALYFAEELDNSQRVAVSGILERIAWLLESPELSDNILNAIKLTADLERGESDE